MDKRILKYQVWIIIIGALLFIPFLGHVHLFDWDEINFAESAREMLLTKDYLTVRIFFKPFWEKPPLFIWMQVLSMKLFGVNEFAARFPNAICGIMTLLVLFNLGRKLYHEKFGAIWAMVYCCSVLPFFYFKSGIIDPWFNLFIFIGIYSWILALDCKQRIKELVYILISAAGIGLGMLTKGPVSLLVFGLVAGILFLVNGFRLGIGWKNLILFFVALIFVGGFWFMLQVITGHADVIAEFIEYQIRLFRTKDAGHGGFPLYHFIILLFGMFPASIFAIQGHKYKGRMDRHKLVHIGMITLLWIVLLLFSIVKTKIVHYSSLTYFPLSYLAAYSINQILKGKFKFRIWQKVLLGIVGTVLGAFVILLPVIKEHKEYFIHKGIITHSFTIGNLEAVTTLGWGHSMIGVVFLLGVFSALFLYKRHLFTKIVTLFLSTLFFIYLSMIFIIPEAEKISQNAVIEFIKEKKDQDVYIQSFYKSYAVLFYSNQQIPKDNRIFDIDWLTAGETDKDTYFIFRIDKKEEIMKRYPNIKIVHEKNGYIFSKRTAQKSGS
jgi:4-amino-4-deoxy-L-arabinose transferase-like glycosyltransferase